MSSMNGLLLWRTSHCNSSTVYMRHGNTSKDNQVSDSTLEIQFCQAWVQVLVHGPGKIQNSKFKKGADAIYNLNAPPTHPQLFNINIKVKRQEKGTRTDEFQKGFQKDFYNYFLNPKFQAIQVPSSLGPKLLILFLSKTPQFELTLKQLLLIMTENHCSSCFWFR